MVLIKAEDVEVFVGKDAGCFAYSPDRGLLAVAKGSSVQVFETDSMQLRREFTGDRGTSVLSPTAPHIGEITTIGWFPSGQVIYTGASDTQIKLWNLATGACIQTLAGVHKSRILNVHLIERGRNLISVANDGTAVLWECGSGQALKHYRTNASRNTSVVHSEVSKIDFGQASPHFGENQLFFDNDYQFLTVFENRARATFNVRNETILELHEGNSDTKISAASDTISGTETGEISGVKFTNSPVTKIFLARIGKRDDESVIAIFRDGTILVLGQDLSLQGLLSGNDCQEIVDAHHCESTNQLRCLATDGYIRIYYLSEICTHS